jgi:hypothetical protein
MKHLIFLIINQYHISEFYIINLIANFIIGLSRLFNYLTINLYLNVIGILID